jgi:hypothetical protein
MHAKADLLHATIDLGARGYIQKLGLRGSNALLKFALEHKSEL